MKYNKLKAFTLAEVMVLLLTLSILLAAFSPVFTTRFSNYSSDDVWSFVPGDDENDAYYDTTNKSLTAQAFIGMTPAGPYDISLYSSDASSNVLYSKLVIRAANNIKIAGLKRPQNQMQFRYGSSFNNPAGNVVGALFAGNGNFLVGGNYQAITNNAKNNTAYGYNTLSKVTNALNNTAVGYNALSSVTTGKDNTAVGTNAAKSMETSTGNTIIGYNAANKANGSSMMYNTIVGNYSAQKSIGSYNTFIGNYVASNNTSSSASHNVGIGNYALNTLSAGTQNTAVGYNALANITSGKSNTAVGINACTQITTGSNKTCIGAYSASKKNQKDANVDAKSLLFSGDEERIFIGGPPMQYISTLPKSEYPAAVLEIHNVTNSNNNLQVPINNSPSASVVINGNLIVRGMTYLEVPIRRPQSPGSIDTPNTYKLPKGLVAFKMIDIKHKSIKAFAGADGAYRSYRSVGDCNGCRTHLYNDVRQNCICTSTATNTSYNTTNTDSHSKSYDWSSPAAALSNGCRKNAPFGGSYKDKNLDQNITLSDSAGSGSPNSNYWESDDPMAHRKDGSSCCPVLKSDRRLKNVGEKFTGGLSELKKLNIYNYTFKNDPDKVPHVGVIAQDLKTVFPNAVTRGNNGYLQIRWDEMFYSLVNAVKEINSKVTKLAAKVTKTKDRITVLKKDNANLNAQLDKLSDELTVLEAKKK